MLSTVQYPYSSAIHTKLATGFEHMEFYGSRHDGQAGGDVLTGGDGADSFIFRSIAGQGHDVITDFNASDGDHIVLHLDLNSTIDSYEDFMQAATQTENGVLIDLDGQGSASSSILIAGAVLEDLTPEKVFA